MKVAAPSKNEGGHINALPLAAPVSGCLPGACPVRRAARPGAVQFTVEERGWGRSSSVGAPFCG